MAGQLGYARSVKIWLGNSHARLVFPRVVPHLLIPDRSGVGRWFRRIRRRRHHAVTMLWEYTD